MCFSIYSILYPVSGKKQDISIMYEFLKKELQTWNIDGTREYKLSILRLQKRLCVAVCVRKQHIEDVQFFINNIRLPNEVPVKVGILKEIYP